MGIFHFFSSSKLDKYDGYFPAKVRSLDLKPNLPNPKSDNYEIKQHLQLGVYLIIKIRYLDCTNYEGNKILVFKNCTLKKLLKQKLIDPHFSNNKKFHSPIARFEPTKTGWSLARKLILNQ